MSAAAFCVRPRVVFVLAPRERDEFVPPPLSEELANLFPGAPWADPGQLEPAAWPAHLREWAPEILVTCWQTPALPAELPDRLRYVCHLGGSVRSLVTRRHLEQGLWVTNWGGAVARTVAEGALTLILDALRRSTTWAWRMHVERGWRGDGDRVASLFERRVGIHGFGLTARELTRLLAPFGNAISSHAPEVGDEVLAAHGVARAPTLEALFAENDIVVELAPLTEATRRSVRERHLRLIPAGGVFVNVARGPIVDEAGLVRVAREGRLQIGLDVYAQEPLPADSALRGLANVTLWPHVAGPTHDRRRDAGAHAVRNLRAYVEGRPLDGVMTVEIFDHAT